MLVRWRRIDEESRRLLWRFYGLFSGLMFIGSCTGIVACICFMRYCSYLWLFAGKTAGADLSPEQRAENAALYDQWRGAFLVLYSVEFMCLSVVKLMVLDRINEFAFSSTDRQPQRWALAARVVMSAVVAGGLLGVAGNVAAASSFGEGSALWRTAASAYASNNTDTGTDFSFLAAAKNKQADIGESVAALAETCVLLVIIAAFAVVGAMSLRRLIRYFRSEPSGPINSALKRIKRQIRVTVAVVLVTFLLRAV